MARKAKGQELINLRELLNSRLAEIVASSDSIREAMASQPHHGGFGSEETAYLRLKPHTGTFLTDSTNGTVYAQYQDDKGNWYEVKVSRGKSQQDK